MQIKKLLAPMFAPLVLSAAFGLMACGDDSSAAPANPVVDPSTDPSLIPTDPSTNPSVNPTDPSTNPTVTPTDPTPTPVVVDPTAPWTPTVALASTANTAYPATVYQAWKPFHFVTFEEESVYYADIAQDYADIFFPEFLPAGRVIWSSQTTGYYAKQCQDKNSTVPGMKARGCTVSEGTGYGMLLTYFNGDEDAFIRLWNYSRAYRAYNSTSTVPVYLTPWITFSFHYNEIDNSSATDADLDIATSLVLMYYKTQNQAYLADALNIIGAIWDHEVNKTTLLLYSGDTDVWNGGNGKEVVYNPSYFSPVALRLFAMVDLNHNWAGVLDAMYAYMAKIQAAGTGVFPDWSNDAGVAAIPNNGSADNTYWTFNKESVRIPWRIAWDYYWFQDPRALAILNTLNAFIVAKSAGDPSSTALATNYSWDPAKKDITTATVPSHWLSAWCATGLGTNPTWLESCTALVNAKVPSNSGSSYFTDILLGMYSALLNGAFVRPF